METAVLSTSKHNLFAAGKSFFGVALLRPGNIAKKSIAAARLFSILILDSTVSTGNDDVRGGIAYRDFFASLRLNGNGLYII